VGFGDGVYGFGVFWVWGGWVLGFGFGFLGFGEMWVVGVDYIVF